MRNWMGVGISMAAMFLGGPAWTKAADDPLLRPIALASSKRWLAPQAPVVWVVTQRLQPLWENAMVIRVPMVSMA